MPGHWAGSARRSTLPGDWGERRQRILDRDRGRCQWREGGTLCGEHATEVDHVRRGNDHSDANLRALCDWHHGRKSSAEGNAARVRLSNKRAPERHPGLR